MARYGQSPYNTFSSNFMDRLIQAQTLRFEVEKSRRRDERYNLQLATQGKQWEAGHELAEKRLDLSERRFGLEEQRAGGAQDPMKLAMAVGRARKEVAQYPGQRQFYEEALGRMPGMEELYGEGTAFFEDLPEQEEKPLTTWGAAKKFGKEREYFGGILGEETEPEKRRRLSSFQLQLYNFVRGGGDPQEAQRLWGQSKGPSTFGDIDFAAPEPTSQELLEERKATFGLGFLETATPEQEAAVGGRAAGMPTPPRSDRPEEMENSARDTIENILRGIPGSQLLTQNIMGEDMPPEPNPAFKPTPEQIEKIRFGIEEWVDVMADFSQRSPKNIRSIIYLQFKNQYPNIELGDSFGK